MSLLLQIFLILAGFVMLIKGADLLVDGACSVARRFNVSDLVVGLTIVAIGTSAPELVVSTISALKGSSGIAIGNVMGSNIANLLLVLGGAGALAGTRLSGTKRRGISLSSGTIKRELPACLGAAVILLAMLIWNPSGDLISRTEAFILLGLGIAYMAFMLITSHEPPPLADDAKPRTIPLALGMVLIGLALLVAGGELIVRNAVEVARFFNVSEALIGLTIVGLGTSLPELATCIAALKKGKDAIAVGNVVGSNIMNTSLVLGVAGAITPIQSDKTFVGEAAIITTAASLLLLFMWTGKSHKLDRWEAVLYVLGYFAYIAFAIHRG